MDDPTTVPDTANPLQPPEASHGAHAVRKNPSYGTHRLATVVVASLLAAVLCIAAIAGDVFEVLPGPLTLQPTVGEPVPVTYSLIGGDVLPGEVDFDLPIDQGAAQALLNALLANPAVGNNSGVIIADGTGNVVVEHNSGTPLEPASTMKTLTALAASTTLDMASTFDTEVYMVNAAGEAVDGQSDSHSDGQAGSETNGADSQNANDAAAQTATLILKGNGDMLLSAGANDLNHVNGRAGLATLAASTAQKLKQQGVTSVNLKYDDTLFGDVRSPERINADGAVGLYYTPISSMAVDGGRLWPNGVHEDNPDEVTRYPQLSTTTASDAASAFATRLGEEGIEVEGAGEQVDAPKDVTPIATVSSAPLSEVLRYTLRNSDNTLAELFGRLVALKAGESNTPEGATSAITTQITSLGVNTEGLTMQDCSGLSRGSAVTATTLNDIQQLNLKPGMAVAAAEGLSVMGLVGTATNRLTEDEAAGLIRVKTGSLSSVSSLTGTVSRTNNGVLSFAVIVNNPNTYGAKQAINEFASKLAGL